ncbi:MAG TPA: hypothetical protein VFE07_02935 [Marmoricola sp.]|nr:hypothetical protein [Marmoricola sp.]
MKRRLMRLGAVIGASTLSVFAFSPAFAATNDTGGADSSASTGTGLFNLLDTDACTATTPDATGTGRCGDGLNLNNQINAFSQNASAPAGGTSTADASVAPIDITNLGTSLDLTGIIDGLDAIDTGTILDQIVGPLAQIIKDQLEPLLGTALTNIDDALQTALAGVTDSLPLGLQIGAVESHCTATAEPLSATGDSTVAGLHLVVHLGDQVINVPITAGTAPNSNLLVGAPQDLVDAIIQGLEDTFTTSLGSKLSALNLILSTFQTQVTDKIFDALEPTLLQGLADALEPIIAGTVNKQVPVSPSSTGEIEVTALELKVLSTNVLDLARSHCGPNGRGTGPGGGGNPGSPGNPNLPNVPTVVDSGMAGHADHTARNVLGATAALMLLAGTAGLVGYRRMLTK